MFEFELLNRIWVKKLDKRNKLKQISKQVLQENEGGKFGMLCFLVTPVLRFALSPYGR